MNIWSFYDEARQFSAGLTERSLRGTLDDILTRNSRRLGITNDHAFELFAISNSFGFLYVDHTEELRVDKPLHLEPWSI